MPSPDAARLWMFAWHPPMQQEPEEMQRRRLLTEKHVIIEVNSKISLWRSLPTRILLVVIPLIICHDPFSQLRRCSIQWKPMVD